ncbi:MAG: holo-ACP synthase [Treponema sp.]|uniref:holo-ACP synthase n=1 Tax=Treponema sp. TaxID=166 RepID=UPI00298EA768|nr:holo-ACP synthase [Treponema sp.]MCQ2600039.1 holo-ACP synthase [Treponema sp.]
MIFGNGIDLAEVSRFKKWITDGELINRYFNEKERKEKDCLNLTDRQLSSLCQHYAVRFAAKEAFSKALGTGVVGFELKDVYVLNESSGKPYLVLENKAKEIFNSKCPGGKIHVSLSHEKEYAIASVIIEI